MLRVRVRARVRARVRRFGYRPLSEPRGVGAEYVEPRVRFRDLGLVLGF